MKKPRGENTILLATVQLSISPSTGVDAEYAQENMNTLVLPLLAEHADRLEVLNRRRVRAMQFDDYLSRCAVPPHQPNKQLGVDFGDLSDMKAERFPFSYGRVEPR